MWEMQKDCWEQSLPCGAPTGLILLRFRYSAASKEVGGAISQPYVIPAQAGQN